MGAARVPEFHDAPLDLRLYDRQLVVFTPSAGGIAVIDLDSRNVTRMLRDLQSGDLLSDAYMTADRQHVLQMNRDGSFHLWFIETGDNVLSGRIVEDEIALWTADNRFDATAEAASLIDLRFPGQNGQFSLDRFDAVLYVDDLAARVMRGAILPAAGV